jgi:hypothetical protein
MTVASVSRESLVVSPTRGRRTVIAVAVAGNGSVIEAATPHPTPDISAKPDTWECTKA